MNQIVPRGFAIGGVAHPVELLRDGQGVYGIGLNGGVEGLDEIDRRAPPALLRPDRLDQKTDVIVSDRHTIYQMITGGFRHGMFSRTSEEALRQVIHHQCDVQAQLNAHGGTSDARFLAPHVDEIIEFGLNEHSIHEVDEHSSLKDLETLAVIYQKLLEDYLLGNH